MYIFPCDSGLIRQLFMRYGYWQCKQGAKKLIFQESWDISVWIKNHIIQISSKVQAMYRLDTDVCLIPLLLQAMCLDGPRVPISRPITYVNNLAGIKVCPESVVSLLISCKSESGTPNSSLCLIRHKNVRECLRPFFIF